MNKREANKLTMFDAVVSFMNANNEKYASVPILGETLTEFSGIVDEIKAMNLEFIGSTKGETADKRAKEEALIGVISKIANALFVLGVKTKNTDLIVKYKVTKSGLDALREPLLINKCSEILTVGNENKEVLVNYGINDATLTDAQNALDAFQEAIGKKSDVHANSVAEREALKVKFEEGTAILNNQLDPMMVLFEDSDPLFYDGYMNARSIKDLGITHEAEEETT